MYVYICVCVHWFMHSTQNIPEPSWRNLCLWDGTGVTGVIGSEAPWVEGLGSSKGSWEAPHFPRKGCWFHRDRCGRSHCHWSCIIYHHLSSSIITIILYLQPWDTLGHLILAHQICAHHEKGHAMNHPTPNISTWVTWHRCRASKDLRRWSIGCTSHRHWCWHWSWSEQLRQLFPLGSGIGFNMESA